MFYRFTKPLMLTGKQWGEALEMKRHRLCDQMDPCCHGWSDVDFVLMPPELAQSIPELLQAA